MSNETERAHEESRSDPGATELEELFTENLRWLRGWLGARLRGRDRQEVDDLCQDILLRALRGHRRLRDRSKFPAWLYRIATNVLRDHVRKGRRRRMETSLTDMDIHDRSPQEPDTDRAEAVRLAVQEVLDLPPKLREPMLLRHVDDLSYAEIGRILGISENAVQVRMFRARDRLRKTAAYRKLFDLESAAAHDEPSEPARSATSRPRPPSTEGARFGISARSRWD